jgi:hypothetical protein
MRDKIINILMKELGYSDHVASLTANDLANIQPQLRPALQVWIDTRSITDIEVLGFSIKQLMKQRGYTFPSALISMDWLLTEPEIAKKELSDEIRR